MQRTQKARLAAGSLRKSAANTCSGCCTLQPEITMPSLRSQSTVRVNVRALWYPYESYLHIQGATGQIKPPFRALKVDAPCLPRRCFGAQSIRLQGEADVARAQIPADESFASSPRVRFAPWR